MELGTLVDRFEQARGLDRAVKPVRRLVRRVVQPQPLRDVLHGTWLGHPLHPVLTDVPIGCWTSAAVLDLIPGTGPATSTLIGTGIVTWFPTAWAGWTDWSELNAPEQRTGLVHATANATALGLYSASLVARARGQRAKGKLLGFAGLGTLLFGGLLGGHLAYRRAAGVNHTADVFDTGPTMWTSVGRLDELPDRTPVALELGRVPVLLYRDGTTVRALVDRCAHLSGPLHEGTVIGSGPDACIRCPWHGSTFRLRDGGLVHGPATTPQPALETRVTADAVEVRLIPI